MLAINKSDLLAEVRERARGLEHGTRSLILEMAERYEILDQVDVVPVVRLKEVLQNILETLDTIKAPDEELANYAERNSYYRGKVNAYEVARRLVNAALTDLCSYGERKDDG